MTGATAIERLDGYLKGALDAAPAGLKLKRVKAEATDDGGCSKSSIGDDFTGQVKAEVSYETPELSPEAATQYLAAVAGSWEQEWGGVDRSDGHVGVRFGDEDFALYGNYWPGTHRVSVSGTSGCIWVDGTPGPDDNP